MTILLTKIEIISSTPFTEEQQNFCHRKEHVCQAWALPETKYGDYTDLEKFSVDLQSLICVSCLENIDVSILYKLIAIYVIACLMIAYHVLRQGREEDSLFQWNCQIQ